MAEEWIVRVHGKEYGPVDLDELRAWKEEGRLIRENFVREEGSKQWIRAGELPEIFSDEPEELDSGSTLVRRLTFGEIFSASWRIYRQGFARFFALALLVSLPSCILQLVAPFLHSPANQSETAAVIAGAATAFVMLMLLIIAWPFSVAGLQILAADLFAGRDLSLGELLRRAKPLWTRIFILGLIVYGSYFFWTIIPLLVALSLAPGAGSVSTLLMMLLLLVFAAYMVARLFINFLFWQQSGALGGLDAIQTLRESKELARGETERPRIQRPLYRGAIIASLWLLVIILLNVAIELPIVLFRLRGVTSLEQAATMLQAMTTKNSPDLLSSLTTVLSCFASAVLRPWLAASFVLLYLDAKRGQRENE